MSDLATWAVHLAQRLLAERLPTRWEHDCAVIAKARSIAGLVGDDGGLLVAAAALHDIGHAPEVRGRSFGPLDAALYLQRLDTSPRLCSLVANHACAASEAALRGLGEAYRDFPDEASTVSDALWWACLTTGPAGEPIDVADRIAGWSSSYATDEIVGRWAVLARPNLLGAVDRTEARLRELV